jgi:hypothetical protein
VTIGIYKLAFEGTNKVYIGKSNNIGQRVRNHKYLVSYGKSSNKLNRAFNLYGYLSLHIVETCALADLNNRELAQIHVHDAIANGFNSIDDVVPPVWGENGPSAKHTNAEYIDAAYLLAVENKMCSEVSDILGMTRDIVKTISTLKNHSWLEQAVPEIYALLKAKKHTGNGSAEQRGIVYPKVKSPTGEIYSVTNLREFCREHGLKNSGFIVLLQGKLKRGVHKAGHWLQKITKFCLEYSA